MTHRPLPYRHFHAGSHASASIVIGQSSQHSQSEGYGYAGTGTGYQIAVDHYIAADNIVCRQAFAHARMRRDTPAASNAVSSQYGGCTANGGHYAFLVVVSAYRFAYGSRCGKVDITGIAARQYQGIAVRKIRIGK